MNKLCLTLSTEILLRRRVWVPRLAAAAAMCTVLAACPADSTDPTGDGSSSSTTQGTTTTTGTTTDGTGSSTDAPSSSTTATSTTDPSTSTGTGGESTGETSCPTHVSTERVANLVDISLRVDGPGAWRRPGRRHGRQLRAVGLRRKLPFVPDSGARRQRPVGPDRIAPLPQHVPAGLHQ